MTNEFPKPENDGTPNYYGGISNTPQQPPASPYGSPYGNPVTEQPASFNTAPQYGQAQPPYPTHPYQQMPNYGAVPQTQTNKNALISLITSLITLFILFPIPLIGTAAAVVGIVFGHKGIKETQNVPNSGNGIAIAGTICGYLSLVASLIIGIMVLLIIVAAASSTGSSY